MIAIKQNQKALKYVNETKFPEIHEYWRLLYE